MNEAKQYVEQAFGRLPQDLFRRARVLLLLHVGAEQVVKSATPGDLITEDHPGGMTSLDMVAEVVSDIIELGESVADLGAWAAAATETRKTLNAARLFVDEPGGPHA